MLVLCYSSLLIGCSLFSEETREIGKSYRKITFSNSDQEIYTAITQILTEDGFRIKKKSLREGVIETFPKKNKGLFAKAFSGGLYRTTVNAYIQRVNPEKTLLMLSMKIEKQVIIKEDELEAFDQKVKKRWDAVEVIEDQLSLLGNDSYENYFSRIKRAIRKNRSGRLMPASSFGYNGSLMRTNPAKPKKAADTPKPSPEEEKLPEGFEDLD